MRDWPPCTIRALGGAKACATYVADAEDESGGVVGLEIKAAATVRPADFAGLRKLAAASGRTFRLGVVLHDGDAVTGFGERLVAAPISCLWRAAPEGP